MAELSNSFQLKIETLERKFEVASIIFSKYNKIFQNLFSGKEEKPASSGRRGGRRKHQYVNYLHLIYMTMCSTCKMAC